MPGSSISGLSGSGVGECPICLGSFDDPVYTTCGHRFCQSCIRSHISVSRLAANLADRADRADLADQPSPPACPLCRHPISEQDFVASPTFSPMPSPRASVHGVEVLVRFAHGGVNAQVNARQGLGGGGGGGSRSSHRHHHHHHHRRASELSVALPRLSGGGDEVGLDGATSGGASGGASGASGAPSSGVDDERGRGASDAAPPLPPPRVRDTRARTRIVEGVDQPTTTTNNPFRRTRRTETSTTTTTPVVESSLLCPYQLRRFLRPYAPPARRVADSESSRLIARLRNLIILSSFIMIIQGIVSVCFWEYSIDVKRTKENVCSPIVCSSKRHHSSSDVVSATKVHQNNCKKRLLSPLRDIIHEMRSELSTFKRFFNSKKTGDRLQVSGKTTVHIKNSGDFLDRLDRSLIYSFEPQLKRCFRDNGTNREKALSLASVDTSTLPLVVFVVSVSIVPILILGLFLLTHKCRACSD